MKIVMLVGNNPNQMALCHKLQSYCDIAAIVISENVPRKLPSRSRRLRLFFNKIAGRLVGYPFAVAWQELQKSYKTRYPTFPDVPLLRVNNINDLDSVRAIEKYAPDLVVVSGTNLVGKQIIKLASNKKGIINLHTGISPYIKGGPNCTNWCLAEQSFHLIGNTVMWLDQGIDSGNIIATEQTPLTGQETLVELHWKVMEHAHNLYIRVIKKLANGQTVPSVPQESIGKGKTFYTIEWNGWAMLKALINFRRYYSMYFLDGQEYRNQSSRLNLVLTQK